MELTNFKLLSIKDKQTVINMLIKNSDVTPIQQWIDEKLSLSESGFLGI